MGMDPLEPLALALDCAKCCRHDHQFCGDRSGSPQDSVALGDPKLAQVIQNQRQRSKRKWAPYRIAWVTCVSAGSQRNRTRWPIEGLYSTDQHTPTETQYSSFQGCKVPFVQIFRLRHGTLTLDAGRRNDESRTSFGSSSSPYCIV